jgi:amidase
VTITELQRGMKSGKFTVRSLTENYLARIDEIDQKGPAINAIICYAAHLSRSLVLIF